MKQSTVLLGLAAGLAAAAHHEHGHAHNHARRGEDGTVTSWDITTEWTYVTVTGAPGAGQTADSHPGPVSHESHAAAAPSSSAAAAKDEVSAAAVTPAPVSGASDPIAIQNSKNAAQASINAAQQSANMAHQSSMLALQAGGGKASASAPAQATSVAAVSSAAAPSVVQPSAAAASPSSGGSTGGSGSCKGSTVSTFMTYYGGGGALGSCGSPVNDDNPTVAMPPSIIGDKSICGSKMNIWVDGQSTPQVVTITDTCPGCTDGHVDAAQGWAQKVAGQKIITDGHVPIKYCILG